MESLNSFISDDANSMSSGTINEISVLSIKIDAPADDHNEVRDGSSLEDDSRSLHHEDVPVEVSKERRIMYLQVNCGI